MKVTYVVNALGEGGTERSLADLLPGLRDGGVDARIITLRSRGDEGVEPILRAQGFEITTIGSASKLQKIKTLRSLLRQHEPDVVHTMLFEANLYARLATVGMRSKILISLVNTTYSEARLADPRLNKFKIRAVQALDTAMGRFRTDHFHAVSNAVKSDAVKALRLPQDKVTVIERGRRADTLPPRSDERRLAARAMLDLSPQAEVLVAVGRQEYQKGHRYLVESMNSLQHRPDLLLLVAGREGNESDELQRLLQKWPDAAKHTRLLGHRSDVADILAAADIFVFPSLFEGMPGAVIEAMASGLPVVASDIEPVHDVAEIGNNADVAPPRDPAKLAAAIDTLLNDPDRRASMGTRSREIFEERFTMERSVASLLDLYRSLSSR